MKNIIFKIIVVVLIFTGCVSSCEKDDIDYSNIEDLYAQPLPVIQKCVEGKWKWIEISRWGALGLILPMNTTVEITRDSVVVTQVGDDPVNLNFSFFYRWENMETLADRMDYVMWNIEQNKSEWYFYKIQNDTLIVYADNVSQEGFTDRYLFVRIK